MTPSFRAALAGVAMMSGGAHPIHTTLTELVYDERTAVAELSVRVFVDDLPATTRSASDGARYVAGAVTVVARDGRAAPLESCGERKSGDLVWICLRARLPGGLAGARLKNSLLFERFSDQVNIVQVTNGLKKATMLFVKGGGEKTL